MAAAWRLVARGAARDKKALPVPPAPGEGARGSPLPARAEWKAERRHCSEGSSPIDGSRRVLGLLIPSLFAYGK